MDDRWCPFPLGVKRAAPPVPWAPYPEGVRPPPPPPRPRDLREDHYYIRLQGTDSQLVAMEKGEGLDGGAGERAETAGGGRRFAPRAGRTPVRQGCCGGAWPTYSLFLVLGLYLGTFWLAPYVYPHLRGPPPCPTRTGTRPATAETDSERVSWSVVNMRVDIMDGAMATEVEAMTSSDDADVSFYIRETFPISTARGLDAGNQSPFMNAILRAAMASKGEDGLDPWMEQQEAEEDIKQDGFLLLSPGWSPVDARGDTWGEEIHIVAPSSDGFGDGNAVYDYEALADGTSFELFVSSEINDATGSEPGIPSGNLPPPGGPSTAGENLPSLDGPSEVQPSEQPARTNNDVSDLENLDRFLDLSDSSVNQQ